MPVWKYAKNKEVTSEQITEVLSTLVCFKCGKEFHTEDCPFARLRAELNALKESGEKQ
jgi:hypothetical protein